MDIRRGAFLPNLITVGNGVCGFAALVNALKIQVVPDPTTGALDFTNPKLFAWSAWLILIGMVFDVFDGKVARLSGRTSDLGAQLDSLCDLTTFGLAPAVLVVRLGMIYPDPWGKAVWFFCLAYFLGALLRLARFNAENEHEEEHHLCFKGLPSPGAAGCVASLVIFHRYITEFTQKELHWLEHLVAKETVQRAFFWIPYALPILMLILGYTMVSSRLKYDHVASRIFNRRHSFEFFVSLVFASLLAAVVPEVVLPAVFIGYLAWTPLVAGWRRIRGKGKKGVDGRSRDAGDGFLVEPPLDRRPD
jgi:CDP-diacylglycerol---serine O-phosphatidyltransferase